MSDQKVTILGAGSYGTALALCFARKGVDTLLWGRNAEHMATMQRERENQRYLPDCKFPDCLIATSDLAATLKDARNVVVVVPSSAFSSVLAEASPLLQKMLVLPGPPKGLSQTLAACYWM